MYMRQNHSVFIMLMFSMCLGTADSGIVDISFCFLSMTLLSALMCKRNCPESMLRRIYDMNQANLCAGVCEKSTFYLGTLLIAEKETKKRDPGSSKIIGLFWILQTLFLSLLDPLQKIILVQIFNHIASHLSFNPQHTHGRLPAVPEHRRQSHQGEGQCRR